ncbi:MAG: ABC transporter ATP-binding protein, partial [Phycisphaerae bacterium]|nr:ABC transporter ATP-binding protein [Phycisphaerae bacterium]
MSRNLYSDSDGSEAANGQARIALTGVGLRFILYGDKRALLKEAMVSRLLRRRIRRIRPTEVFWALSDVDLTIEHGEKVGIIGPNGAGKTTLMKLIAGIFQPTTGRLEVVGDVAPLINLGAGFNQEISARENIILYGSLMGYSRREMEDKADRVLAFAGVEKFQNVPTKYFSSGMLRRLTFAVGTDILPEILLIDEVFSAGDAQFRRKASQRMSELIDVAHILVMVSHNPTLIEELCDRVIWLERGRIVADGDPASICDDYLAHMAAEQG